MEADKYRHFWKTNFGIKSIFYEKLHFRIHGELYPIWNINFHYSSCSDLETGNPQSIVTKREKR